MPPTFFSFLATFVDPLPLPLVILDSNLVVQGTSRIYHHRIAPDAQITPGNTRLRDLPGWGEPHQIAFIDALAAGQRPQTHTTVSTIDDMVMAVHADYFSPYSDEGAQLPPFTMLHFGSGSSDIGKMATSVFAQANMMFYIYDSMARRFLMRTPLFDDIDADPPGPYSASPDRFLAAIHELDRPRAQQMLSRLRSGQATSLEYRAILEGHEHHWISHTVPNMRDGEITHLIGLIQDVTEERKQDAIQQKLTAERASAEREEAVLRAKASFLSLVSHEFRTPLAIIQTSTELLRNHYDNMPEDRRDKHFDQIETQVFKLTSMLNEILHIGRIGTATFETNARRIFIEQFCRDISRSVQTSTGNTHNIVFSSAGVAPPLIVDREYLEHALTHVIENAIHFSPDQERIEIDIDARSDRVLITVTDHGIGIEPADLPHVFEFFYRGSNAGDIAGNGLGLSFARQVIELHHGHIKVESTPDQGTIVTITLPLNNGLIDYTAARPSIPDA